MVFLIVDLIEHATPFLSSLFICLISPKPITIREMSSVKIHVYSIPLRFKMTEPQIKFYTLISVLHFIKFNQLLLNLTCNRLKNAQNSKHHTTKQWKSSQITHMKICTYVNPYFGDSHWTPQSVYVYSYNPTLRCMNHIHANMHTCKSISIRIPSRVF